MKGRYYLYRHIREDKDEVFYVGQGSKKPRARVHRTLKGEYTRAFDTKNRNVFWNRVVAKTKYSVHILLESDNKEYIKSKEIEFIALYGRRDKGLGTLTNISDGGENSSGKSISDAHRAISRRTCSLRNPGNEFGNKRVQQSTIDGIYVNEFRSIKVASEATGIKYETIRKSFAGRTKGGGFTWKFT